MCGVVEERERDREREQHEQVEVQQRERPAEVEERQQEQHAQRQPHVQRVDVPPERARVAARHRPRRPGSRSTVRARARTGRRSVTWPISFLPSVREVADLPAERPASGRRRRRSPGTSLAGAHLRQPRGDREHLVGREPPPGRRRVRGRRPGSARRSRGSPSTAPPAAGAREAPPTREPRCVATACAVAPRRRRRSPGGMRRTHGASAPARATRRRPRATTAMRFASAEGSEPGCAAALKCPP